MDRAADQLPETIGKLVLRAAAEHPDDDAVADVALDRRVTFSQLAALAAGAGAGCLDRGVEPGDRVAIWAPNSIDWVIAALGAVSVGAALVPLNTRYKTPEASWILERASAKFCFVSKPFLSNDYAAQLAGAHETVVLDEGLWSATHSKLEARIDSVRGDDVSDILFTSGTTGRPKGVITTHAQSLRVFQTWSDIVGLRHGDRYLVVNPFFHTFGYKAGILACLLKGATIVPQQVFDVDTTIDLIEAERITVLPGPPTIYSSILDHSDRAGRALGSLRVAVTGAAVVPVALIERMQRDLEIETVLTAYGLTEATGTATMCRVGDDAVTIATTSGRAIPDTEVRVVDASNEPLPIGEPGEIVVRGYNVMSGYFDEPEATASTIDSDGWLHTGDIGVLDEAGNLRITDRLKDMYVVGGFNAYPAEIEQVLATHPAIAESAVIGVPDERLGEVGRAVVVARPGASIVEADLISWCRERMANFKVPRSVVVVTELPRNASGKVRKLELRDEAGL